MPIDIPDILVSVVVLVCVSLAAESGSPLLAAFAATAPTGTALSLYLIANRRGASQQDTVVFLGGAARGLTAAIGFCASAYVATRRGVVAPTGLIACGLAGWGASWFALSALS